MTFVIAYHDPGHANSAGVTVAGSELDAMDAIERLRREGYEVTGITPPLAKHAVLPALQC
jgi:hypothetical protein